jgi:dTMP kinase
MASGKFITFEGGEGSGKSTQARLLALRLGQEGIEAAVTREPGGTPFAEQVRKLILGPDTAPHDATSEALLFYAARADHLATIIRPALAAGRWVLCDRFSDSTRVYQSLAGDLPHNLFAALEAMVVAPTFPVLTCILDLPVEEGLRRASDRRHVAALAGHDRYEARTVEFHQRLRDGFLFVAKSDPQRCAVIDATGDQATVSARVWSAVAQRLLATGS